MSRVIVPLVDGFEEIEALTIVDILRRADIDVATAAVGDNPVTAAHGVRVEADTTMAAARDDQDVELLALPGGPGTGKLGESADVRALAERLHGAGRWVTAICAAPSVLSGFGLLEGRQATSFPAVQETMEGHGVNYREEPVVVDGPFVTSRGPGTAMDFALKLVEVLEGRPRRDEVESRLMRPA
jgi:4-methyl-5(b-hydroxyethyl)-thiazole monophosphate biosynthesis